MSEAKKNYPTRMHEVLGVGVDEEVTYKSTTKELKDFRFFVDEYGSPRYPSRRLLDGYDMADIINHPERITRRPRLTEQQVEQLKVAHQAFEFNWLARHKSGLVAAFKRKPVKGNNGCWFVDELVLGYDFGLAVREGSLICSLVSWSDPEPLDIVATLKAAGVEVE